MVLLEWKKIKIPISNISNGKYMGTQWRRTNVDMSTYTDLILYINQTKPEWNLSTGIKSSPENYDGPSVRYVRIR